MNSILQYLRRWTHAIFLTAILMVCVVNTGLCTTYYISPSGNDTTGDGTIVLPWKTLHKATQTVTTSGDTIFVLSGIYIETVQCYLSEGVSLEGEGETSIIKSELTNHFVELLTLRSPEGSNGNQFIRNLKFDGQELSTFWAVWVGGRSNVHIYNCTFVDFKDRGIIFSGRNDFFEGPPDSIYATGNKFYNNIVNNCAAYVDTSNGSIYGRGCLNIGGQLGMEIYGNTITQNQRPEGFNGWPIKYMNDGYLKGCKIYNNILKKIPYGGEWPGQNGWDFCIELFNVEGLEIYDNTIQGSIDLNFNWKGSYPYSVWIHHNILSQDTLNSKIESGIIFEFDTETAIVEYNILNNISCGIQFNTRDSTHITNCTIRKNLISNLAHGEGVGTAGGIMIVSEGTNSAMITNMNIDHNTITAVKDKEPWFGMEFGALTYGFASNIKIRNNIVVGFPGAWLQGSDSLTNMDGVDLLFNNTYENGNADHPYWPAGPPTNYVDTSYNLYGLNPYLDSSNNFVLRAISPGIDLGIQIPGIPFVPAGPDLGYAEYGGHPPLATKLADFTGKENKGKNILNWVTASENNSSYFNIDRSNDANYFVTIGRVNASVFSANEIKYNFIDNFPPTGKNYYRLGMVDKDGKTGYSKTISITNRENHSVALTNINLSTAFNSASFVINSTKQQQANLTVLDMTGRIIFSSEIHLQSGNNTITKTTPALSKGIYYVRVITADETVVNGTFTRD